MTLVIRNVTPDKVNPSNLHLWLKAESLSGYSNGSNITLWVDSSGNGYNFTNTANYPTCNANFITGGNGLIYNVAKFSDSTLTCLNANSTSAGNFYSNFSVFGVIYQTSPATAAAIWLDKGVFNASVNGWYCVGNSLTLSNSSGLIQPHAGTIQPLGTNSGVPIAGYLNNWKIMSWIVQSNGTAQGWMNGIPGLATGSITVTSNSNPLVLGSYGVVGDNFGGYIAEVIVYNTALTDIQRRDIENYLKLKFQI